jgi:hypothetical protein
VIRDDLPLGTLAAMLVHAAGESSDRVPESTNAVVLAVRSEAELIAVGVRLAAAGVAHVVIDEPDAPWNGQKMAIGLAPAPRSSVRRHLSILPLL